MFKFFSFRKNIKKEEIPSQVISKLDRIIELLENHERALEKNVHIEKVSIDYLENITFKLDNIEIDDLSGKLIIGNNINTSEEIAESLIQKIDRQQLKQETKSESFPIEKTNKGYRFRNTP